MLVLLTKSVQNQTGKSTFFEEFRCKKDSSNANFSDLNMKHARVCVKA